MGSLSPLGETDQDAANDDMCALFRKWIGALSVVHSHPPAMQQQSAFHAPSREAIRSHAFIAILTP